DGSDNKRVLVRPHVGQRYLQPGKYRWSNQIRITSRGVVNVNGPLPREAAETPVEDVEEPVVGNAELGVPAPLRQLVVSFMSLADRLDYQCRRHKNSGAAGVGPPGSDGRLPLSP